MAVAPTRTDAGLIRRLQARERTAWEELYAEYQPRLRGFAYRLAGNVHDADDLVQETFVRALPALDRLDPETVDLTAYLFATTKNLFLKQVERGKRAEPTAEVPEPDVPTAIEDDPERRAMLRRQQQEVRVANARLDPRQRLVLALCELEERSYAEIGELVGLKENAVAQLVFRARERLRTELRLVQVDPERLPEECRAFLPLLAQHLDGRLSGSKLEATLGHLGSCERCQAALADMREAKRRYRALLLPPLGVSSEEARAAVDAELEHVGYWARAGGRRRMLRRDKTSAMAVVTVTAALCVAGGLGAARLLADSTEPVVAAAASVTRQTAETGTETTAPPVQPRPAGTPKPKPSPKPKPKPRREPQPKPGVASTPEPAPAAPAAPTQTEAPESPATPPTEAVAAAPKSPAAPASTPPAGKKRPQVAPPPPPKDATAPGVTIETGPPASTVEPPAPSTTAPPPDTTPPSVTFVSTPPASTTAKTATFSFSASETGATFACSYDSGPFGPCQSPHTIEGAGVDDHSLAVRATDAAGNTGAAAVASWSVVAPLPDLVVSLANASVTVRNVGEAPAGLSIVLVSGVGAFTIPTLGPGQSSTRTYACKSGTIGAVADETKLVAEADESNYTATRVVTCLGLGTSRRERVRAGRAPPGARAPPRRRARARRPRRRGT